MARVHANGIDIRYEIQGEGACVILAHSLATDLTLWDDQMAALAARFRVLRYDIRGHGGSSAPPGPYDFAMLTGDVLGLMDALGIARAAFVGISLGGMIGQHLALAAPERVEGLVLASTTSRYPAETKPVWAERIRAVSADGLEPQVTPTLERWFTPSWRAGHPAVLARIGGRIRATPVAGYVGCCAAISNLDTADRLKDIRCPTLVVVARQDAGTPPAMGEAIAAAVPGARLAAIDGAAHLCNIEQAAVFNRVLLDFFG